MKKMNLLAIETTGARASAALTEDGKKIVMQGSEETMNHLQHLIPMIDQLLSDCGKIIDDVSVIAVSEGPGSFTGIRIGMATAKALAQVRDIPVVSVPTLESFVFHIPGYRGLVCPVFDARRSQVYAGVYRLSEDGQIRCLAEAGAYELPVYLELLRGAVERTEGSAEITLFGDGLKPYGERILNAAHSWKTGTDRLSLKGDLTVKFAKEDDLYQKASSVAALGWRLLKEGREQSLFDIHPVYLRKAEAERKLEERR